MPLVSFIETKLFTRLVRDLLADDEYGQLQQALIADPEIGQIWMLTIYPKNVIGTIPPGVLRQIKDEIDAQDGDQA